MTEFLKRTSTPLTVVSYFFFSTVDLSLSIILPIKRITIRITKKIPIDFKKVLKQLPFFFLDSYADEFVDFCTNKFCKSSAVKKELH